MMGNKLILTYLVRIDQGVIAMKKYSILPKALDLVVDWLVVWVLWHINLCRLFNAKFIFMQIVLFQTIHFSMSKQFKLFSLYKQF